MYDPRTMDPRTAAALAQMMRANGGMAPGAGGGSGGPQVAPMQMPMQGPAPVAGQEGGMGGPGAQAPLQAPGGTPPGGPPGGGMMQPGAMPGMPPQQMPPPQGGGGQLDPAMVEAVLALQGQGTQRAGLDRQYKLADALRADSKAQLQAKTIPSSTGGMVIAPNWAQGLTSVAGNVMADRRAAAADKAGAGLDAERQSAQRGYFDTLTGQKKKKTIGQQGNWTDDTLAME